MATKARDEMPKKFLVIYSDGCNGERRGDLIDGVPPGFFERNPGEGIWDDDDEGGTLIIELRDNDPVRDVNDYVKENEEEEED
jgi:hypothetical protein